MSVAPQVIDRLHREVDACANADDCRNCGNHLFAVYYRGLIDEPAMDGLRARLMYRRQTVTRIGGTR